MRLLKTGPFVTGQVSRIELHEFRGLRERYAILSHTWTAAAHDEVWFSDLLARCDQGIKQTSGYLSVDLDVHQSLRDKLGWAKLAFALEQAYDEGKDWLWIDTACIDRSSSAELGEAINSAYEWCQSSAICYVFLADVPLEEWHEMKYGKYRTINSRWIRRSWTLTELLAPGHVVFYSMEWVRLGDKHELSVLLSAATGIDVDILEDSNLVEATSIAKRMSWAAHRETALPEDYAYSLMGLMGVNISILYGEGEKKAFLRLQQEIIKDNDDPSIFAWKDPCLGDKPHGLLADSPRAFAGCSNYSRDPYEEPQAFQMTNRGLGICLNVFQESASNLYVATLQCPEPNSKNTFLAIYLERLPFADQQYVRIRCGELGSCEVRGKREQIYVRQSIPPTVVSPSKPPPIQNGVHDIQTVVQNGTQSNGISPVTPPPKEKEPAYSTRVFHVNKFRAWGDYEVLDVQFQPPKFSTKDAKGFLRELKHPANVTEQLPMTFRMAKEGPRLSAAVLVGSGDAHLPRVAILLGTGSDNEPGFDIVECQDLEALKTCSKAFDTIDFGSMAFGKHYRIMVKAEPIVKADVEVFLVEIGVGGLEKALKRESASLQRVDSSKTNGSRMSTIVSRVVKRHSRVPSSASGTGERGSTSSRSIEIATGRA